MREIKFRGFYICPEGKTTATVNGENKTGVWVYGEYYKNARGQIFIIDQLGTWYLVIPETVGQYTGAKSRNNAKIYEGDIILDVDYGYMICTFLHGSFVFQSVKDKWFWIEVMRYVPIVDVVGNIHDNPELLEVQDEHE